MCSQLGGLKSPATFVCPPDSKRADARRELWFRLGRAEPSRLHGALYLLLTCSICPSLASAGLIGSSEFLISVTAGSRFPDVAYGSVDAKYLVAWTDYAQSPTRIAGRFVTAAGAPSGNVFSISSGAAYALFTAVAYNPTNNEFLATWDDGRGDVIWGQRVRGSDGALLGSNFQIGQTGGIRSAVAWNAANNVYLVTWWGGSPSEIRARRVSNTGVLLGIELNISNDPFFDGYPGVASDNANQFLVTWDYSFDNNGYIHGQRVDAATGANIGAGIPITNHGTENRSNIAFDAANGRWLVQFNQSNPGNSYDQYGQLVSTDGSLVGGPLAIAATENFEGDTQFGGDVAFMPLGRYFSSFGTDSGMGGIESFASGTKVTPQTVVLGTGAYTSLSNAADPALNRVLTAWEGRVNEQTSEFHVRGRLYEATDLVPPGQVTSFTATPGSKLIRLNWTNPNVVDFAGTMVRYKLGSAPANPADGQLLVDKPNSPGSSDSTIHAGLVSGTTYHYAAFAHDALPNYAAGVVVSAIPSTFGDFDGDSDVDQIDFGHMQNCLSGDAVPYAGGCIDADSEQDTDVDAVDVAAFINCLRGSDHLPGC